MFSIALLSNYSSDLQLHMLLVKRFIKYFYAGSVNRGEEKRKKTKTTTTTTKQELKPNTCNRGQHCGAIFFFFLQ